MTSTEKLMIARGKMDRIVLVKMMAAKGGFSRCDGYDAFPHTTNLLR